MASFKVERVAGGRVQKMAQQHFSIPADHTTGSLPGDFATAVKILTAWLTQTITYTAPDGISYRYTRVA